MCIFESKEPGKTTPVDDEGDTVKVRLLLKYRYGALHMEFCQTTHVHASLS